MPGRKSVGSAAPAFRQFQQQVRSILNKLRRDIRGEEAELARMKAEEESLIRITGGLMAPRGARAARAAGSEGGGSKRTNWGAALGQLPKQFKASNIRQIRGLKDKRPSEIFAAITRWIEAGSVKRKARGLYERA